MTGNISNVKTLQADMTIPERIKGDPGAVYTPSVAADGTISWTNNGDLPNPDSRNIMGPQGPAGADVSVSTEQTSDGYSVTFTDSTHSETVELKNGEQGPTGPQGEKGDKGDKGDPGEVTTEQLNAAIEEVEAEIPQLPDTPTTDGSYKLVNTITTDSETEEQSSELSWEEDSSSGGGVTYTAGPGIKITENNEIQKESLNNVLGYWIGTLYYGNSINDILRPVEPTSKDEAIALLKAGKIITGYGFSCTTDELVSNPTDPSGFLSNILQVLTIRSSDGSYIFSRYMGTDTFTISSSLHSCLVGNLFIRFADAGYLRNFIFRKMYYYKGSVTATTIPDAIYELATTRIADSLVSEETVPTVNNTINWLYE